MRLKSSIIKPFARLIRRKVRRDSLNAIPDQKRIFNYLTRKGEQTKFGLDHGIEKAMSLTAFQKQVPIRDYEKVKSYIDMTVAGESNILWPGRPKYFAKTSGTTSGSKFIPITRASMPNHFNSARNAMFCQAERLKLYEVFDGMMIFLSGSPQLQDTNGIKTGRLSGIVNHAVPTWLRTNQLPSYTTNCIEDWDEKIEAIIRETQNQPMTMISGIPPWVKDYFERLLAHSGATTIKELFPQFTFFVHGGVNYEPYRTTFDQLIGASVPTVETYPASEGFFAFQDDNEGEGMLLNTNSGIFYEFARADDFNPDQSKRFTLEQVEINQNYVMLISSNAGLWAYNLGDTIEFISLKPFRIRVTGRIKHFISAFGEHVIAAEVERAIQTLSVDKDIQISAFTVGPHINSTLAGKSYHEWFIECSAPNDDLPSIRLHLDQSLRHQNTYYQDLRLSEMLALPTVHLMPSGSFAELMREHGKFGGQNKIPVLSNETTYSDGLRRFLES